MSKHTPGPWVVGEKRHAYDVVIRTKNGDPVAIVLVGGYTKLEGDANARLIAVSPKILAALKGLGCVCPDGTGYGPSEQGFSEHSAKCQAVSDAIEEAVGEKA